MPQVSITSDHTLESRMMGNYHVRFGSGGGESDLLTDPQPVGNVLTYETTRKEFWHV